MRPLALRTSSSLGLTEVPPLLALLVLALLMLALLAPPAAAQLGGGSVPAASHHLNIEQLYSGDYRRAERGFTSDLRGAIRIGQTRWIDSICSYAMLGETYFHQGKNEQALYQFDQACNLLLAYPDWMKRVQFRQPPRPDAGRQRRVPPWGASARQVTYGALPETFLISRGKIDNSRIAETGGVVQTAQFWKVDVVEVIRCTTLAIRRRNQLLGPLAATDRVSKDLADTLGRGGFGPPNHWSNAWAELQTAAAEMGVGKNEQAARRLGRAMLLDGRYDHELTGAALLTQAEIARRAGNGRAAAALAAEAAIAAFAYGELDALTESLWLGYLAHTTSGGQGVYPPLVGALAWADQRNLEHIDWRFRSAMVESQLALGQTGAAEQLMRGFSSRRRDLVAGRPGVRRDLLAALVALHQGDADEARAELPQVVGRQAVVSLSNFQTRLASARFDNGGLSPRLAVGVYEQLLADPSPAEWINDPLDAIANLSTDHGPAFERWFAAALGRREVLPAVEISDLAKRRRFFRAQPLAGRLIAVRRLVESPADELSKDDRLLRQALLAAAPEYQALSQEAATVEKGLSEGPAIWDEGRLTKDADRAFKSWDKLAAAREDLLWQLAFRRIPATMSFPPVRNAAEVQELLEEGDALLLFHRSGPTMHGFLLVAGGQHHWTLDANVRALTGAVADALRGIGNFGQSRPLPASDAKSNDWREVMQELGAIVLGESRLDLGSAKRIIVVPDGPLWHTPFEALLKDGGDSAKTLIDAVPVRYAPTVGLAVGDDRAVRPIRQTGLAMQRATGSSADRDMAEQQASRLGEALATTVALPGPAPARSTLLAATVDQLVADYETEISAAEPYAWAPVPLDRSRVRGALAAWLELPAAAPERLVLTGVHTLAEGGLKAPRRSAKTAALPGEELFHAACGLLGSGPRTVLLTRWGTGGAVHGELIREFAAQMDSRPADEAWRRSVSLAREVFLDPPAEPRLSWSEKDGEPPTATHPFFWAGYLLIDTGVDPRPEPAEAEGPVDQAEPDEPAAAAADDDANAGNDAAGMPAAGDPAARVDGAAEVRNPDANP